MNLNTNILAFLVGKANNKVATNVGWSLEMASNNTQVLRVVLYGIYIYNRDSQEI
jgi:hypothetical protein